MLRAPILFAHFAVSQTSESPLLQAPRGATPYQRRATPDVKPTKQPPGLKARPILPLMSRSLSLVVLHVIFSTKDRRPLLNAGVRKNLFAYLATVARNFGCECYRVGGVEDHVHLAIRFGKEQTIAKLIEELKTSSSKWLKTQGPDLKAFAWQKGYGIFSVGPADLDAVVRYIDAQEEHHRKQTFQEEFTAFLRKYGFETDDKHLWG